MRRKQKNIGDIQQGQCFQSCACRASPMNNRLSVLIWAGAGVAISVALFALFVKNDKQLALLIVFSFLAYVLLLYALSYLIRKIATWIERRLGIILTLVAVVLILSWRLDEINLLWTFLFVALMLGLIWWQWTIKKKTGERRGK